MRAVMLARAGVAGDGGGSVPLRHEAYFSELFVELRGARVEGRLLLDASHVSMPIRGSKSAIL